MTAQIYTRRDAENERFEAKARFDAKVSRANRIAARRAAHFEARRYRSLSKQAIALGLLETAESYRLLAIKYAVKAATLQ